MGHSPQKQFSESPSSETTGWIEKNQGGANMVRTSSIFMQSLICGDHAAAWRREKQKLGVFLIVCHALDLDQRFSHSNSYIVAICRSILMRISAFVRERNALSNISETFDLCRKVAPRLSVLELGQYLNFSENSKGKVCAHDFDH